MRIRMRRMVSMVMTCTLILMSTLITNPKQALAGINLTQELDQNWMADVTNGFTAQASASIESADAATGEKIIYFDSSLEKGEWMEFSAAESEGLVAFDLTSLKLGKFQTENQELTFKVTATKVGGSEVTATIDWGANDGASKLFSGTDFTNMTVITKFKVEIVEFGAPETTVQAYNLEFWQFTIANPITGNSAPILSNFTPESSAFQENLVNTTPQPLVTDITISDSDSTDFNAGQVTVSYTGSALPEDQLSIGNIGNITVADKNINHSSQGTIGTLDGGVDGANLVITLNEKATPAIVQELLKALTYMNSSNDPTSYRTISITVSDGDGGTSGAVTSNISVTGQADSGVDNPALLQNTNTAWITDLNNGFTITANGGKTLGSDTSYIYIASGKTGPESMTISAAEQFSGGVFNLSEIAFDVFNHATNTYTVTIIGYRGDNSTVSVSKTIADNTAFNASELISLGEVKSFDIQIVNLTGSPDITLLSLKSFTIANPKAYVGNVAPSISGLTDILFQENDVNAMPQQIDADIQLTDSDSGNLDSGQITVSYQAAGLPEDQLHINNIGNISVAADKINYLGVGEIGTFSGGANGTNLIITLNSTATPQYATELLRAIAYRNTSNEPNSYRSINITASDGDGGTSTAVSARISVSGQADAGVDAPALVQSLSYPAWSENLNNGFTASTSSGYQLTGDTNSIWLINGPSLGPVTITFTPAEQFTGGMFNLDNIDFYIFNSESNTDNYSVTVTGNIAGGGTVTKSASGDKTEELNSIGLSDMKNLISFSVTITGDVSPANVNEVGLNSFTISNPGASGIAPTITSNGGGATANTSVVENTTAVTTVTATDSDTVGALSYSISGGADAAAFSIDAANGQLVFKAAPDREVKSTYTVIVQVSDGVLTDTQTLTITITDINDSAPVITSNGGGATAIINVAENTTAVTTVVATDVDTTGTLSYSISGGADAAAFNLNATTGVLTFKTAPDYEGAKNYAVTVRVSDGTQSDAQALTITIIDQNDNAPVITSNAGGATANISINENTTAVTTVVATDVDATGTLSYSIFGGADATDFNLNDTTGELTFKTVPDYEVKTIYTVTVQVSDGTNSDTQSITVTIKNVDEAAPVITSNGGGASAHISVVENTTAVTTVTATDSDTMGVLSYSVAAGADATAFLMDAVSGQLEFKVAPDREVNSTYMVIVQASDGVFTDTQTLTITVTDVNDSAPVITSNGGGATAIINVAENTTAVTTVVAADADTTGTLSYSISGGADAEAFNLNATTGVLTFKTAPDYEGTKSYAVIVQVTDGTQSDTQDLTITIIDQNDNAPVITSNAGGPSASISVDENTIAVTTVVATDADATGTLSYSIFGGANATDFNLNATTGELTFKTAPDYEGTKSYAVIVQVTDGTQSDTQDLTITINDINDNTPVITSNGGGATASISINENTTAVTTVEATDVDTIGTLYYSIAGGTDATAFNLNAATGGLTFKSAPDYEGTKSYVVTVQVSDGTHSDTQDITITINDMNDNAPVITSNAGGPSASISVDENTIAVTTVVATDADMTGSLSYSISGGADSTAFNLNAATGELTFKTAPDYEGTKSYAVIVQVTDGTQSDTQDLTITINDINDNAPVITSNDGEATASINIDENTTAVTTVVATDADATGTLSYSIFGGANATDFNLNATTGELTFKTAPDYEGDKSYAVIVQVSDGTYSDTQALTITINDQNDNAPVITSNAGEATASISIIENTTAVTTVVATDIDTIGTLSYSVSGGTDATAFVINSATGQLVFQAAPDREVKSTYMVIVQASDGAMTDTQTLTITVTDINDSTPVITSNGGGASGSVSVDENTTAVTTVVATDADASGTLEYSITGGADATAFNLNAATGELTFKTAPDYEGIKSYAVTVQVSDGTHSDTQALSITISDRNDNAPVITSDAGGATASISINENTTAVTTVKATDVDTIGTLEYSIAGGADATAFKLDFTTGVLALKAAADYEVKTNYAVTVQVSDGINTDTQDLTISITDLIESTPITPGNDGDTHKSKQSNASNNNITIDISQQDYTNTNINIVIPVLETDAYQSMLEADTDHIAVTVKLPDTLHNNGSDSKLLLEAKVLEDVKKSGKDLSVSINNEEGKEHYSWTFKGDELTTSISELTDVNLSLNVSKISENSEISAAIGKETGTQGLVINFGHDGVLPSQASVRIYVGDQDNVESGSKVYLYHYNYDTDKLEALPYSSGYVVDKDGYITINIVHCSDYVILSEEPASDQITSLFDQITVKPDRKTLYLGGSRTSSATIGIDLPSTLEFVDAIEDSTSQPAIGGVKVTYRTSNKKVATIDKAGKITAVGVGKAVITTSITLFNGEKKTFRASITVKKPYITLISKRTSMKEGDSFTFKANAYGVDVKDIVWTTTKKSIIIINRSTGKSMAKSIGVDYVIARIGNISVKLKVVVK